MTSSASASDTHVAGGVGGGEHVGQPIEPARRHQERAHREAALDRAADDLLALGEEQPVLGLEVLAQLDVAQVAVVGEPGIVGRRDLDQLSHQPDQSSVGKASGKATRTTSPTTMIAGGWTFSSAMDAPRVPSVVSTVRWVGIVPSQTTATGVPGLRPPVTSASAIVGAFSTAIIRTTVPRICASAAKSTSDSG